MPEPFYNVVFEGALAGANPLRLRRADLVELRVGDKIPVVLSFESDPRRRLGDIIVSIDEFAKLDDDRKQAAIEDLRRQQPTHAIGEIVKSKRTPNETVLGSS